MDSSLRTVPTSSAFMVTKYSSMHRPAACLKAFSSCTVFSSISWNSGETGTLSPAKPPRRSVSGSFERSFLSTQPVAMQPCKISRMPFSAMGASILRSSSRQKIFSKLRTKAGRSKLSDLLRPSKSRTMSDGASFPRSSAAFIATTPSSSASDGQSASSSTADATVSSTASETKYSFKTLFALSWNLLRSQFGGSSFAKSWSSPKEDIRVRAGRSSGE
mmetsp:Transcript_29110/g.68616  ORF Transcript_29110/g.68616 Transcript_29110/m.68616 type:complete len:218 (-) Transcript_29110:167-820(-)